MSLGQITVIFAIISSIWGGTVYVIDLRNDSRIDKLKVSLKETIVEELGRYKNVYTAEEIVDLVNANHQKDISDIKKLIQDGNKAQDKSLKRFVKGEQAKYDTIYVEEDANKKYMLLGNIVWGKFYVMKKVKLDKFPFE